MEVLGLHSGLSALAADLSEISGEVAGLISDGIFHGVSGVLTSVVSDYLTLNFEAVGRGYAVGWFADRLYELGQSLVPFTMVITQATTAEWVKDARRVASHQKPSRVPP
jgi:hypothetical protein